MPFKDQFRLSPRNVVQSLESAHATPRPNPINARWEHQHKVDAAIARMGTRYVGHPSQHVQRLTNPQ